jgi:dCTP deaminase
VQVPPDYAAEMVPFDPWSANSACTMPASSIPVSAMPAPGGKGFSRAVLDGALARSAVHPRTRPDRRPPWSTRKCLARPDALYGQRIGSNYQAQGLKLSKHFRV